MVETIAPAVGGTRKERMATTLLHVVAATITAAATGGVLAGLGRIVGAPWGRAGLVAVALVAILYAVREGAGVPIPLPQARRQVPEWWRTYFSKPVAAGLYGAGLGVAFATFITYGTFAAVAGAALVSGDPSVGAALTAPFGLARGMAVVAAATRGRPEEVVERLHEVAGGRGPGWVNAGALATIAAAALAAAP